jgi:predicted anti-sigma-YlaC factor YlaD
MKSDVEQCETVSASGWHGRTFPTRWVAGLRNSCNWSIGLALLLACPSCSIRRTAVDKVGDALAGGGTAFASDDDPELIKAAAPFSLKLMESLLNESPRHGKLLLALSSGFTQYSYAFVQQEADELENNDLSAATERQGRARRLYLRARGYGLRGVELRHPGFGKQLREDPVLALKMMDVEDVPQLYWTAAPWAAAISLSKDNPELIADLPIVEAMMNRALELDETFGQGAIHSFFISYEMSRSDARDDAVARSRKHFERAIALSGGQQAGPYVSLAESVCIQKQDLAEFQSLLQSALAINPDSRPEWRLVNLVMQRRARWLLSRADELFLPKDSNEKKGTPTP